MSILIFFLVLFVLILVHEWGHFIAAKKTGMRVDEFGIGFPPKLFGLKKGETEYTLNALPIGGFVKIYGENYEDLANAKVSGVVLADSFTSKSRWAQAIVLVAGVTMNVLFAWLLFFGTYLVGVPTAVDEANASSDASLYISGVLSTGPLNEKIKPGSQILSLSSDGSELNKPTPSTFSEFIQAHPNSDVDIHYRHGDVESVATAKPTLGLISGAEEKSAVGVSLAMVETKQSSIGGALSSATQTTYDGLKNITVGLFTLIAQSVQGTADFSQVAGPIGIVGMVGDAATFGMTALLTFTAMISLNLAVINLLPLPALDGGRLLFVAIEGVTRRTIDPVWMGRVNLVGFALLMLLMVAVTYNDIARIFNF